MRLIGNFLNDMEWWLDRSTCEHRLYLEFRDTNNKRLLIGDICMHLPAFQALASSKNSFWLDTDDIGDDWECIFTHITKLPKEFLRMLYRGEVSCG